MEPGGYVGFVRFDGEQSVPNYNNGPVWRVIYVDVKPGMGDGFWTDIRQNFKPIYDEFKKQGWIVSVRGSFQLPTNIASWGGAIARIGSASRCALTGEVAR
jgi:hypothetical protein